MRGITRYDAEILLAAGIGLPDPKAPRRLRNGVIISKTSSESSLSKLVPKTDTNSGMNQGRNRKRKSEGCSEIEGSAKMGMADQVIVGTDEFTSGCVSPKRHKTDPVTMGGINKMECDIMVGDTADSLSNIHPTCLECKSNQQEGAGLSDTESQMGVPRTRLSGRRKLRQSMPRLRREMASPPKTTEIVASPKKTEVRKCRLDLRQDMPILEKVAADGTAMIIAAQPVERNDTEDREEIVKEEETSLDIPEEKENETSSHSKRKTCTKSLFQELADKIKAVSDIILNKRKSFERDRKRTKKTNQDRSYNSSDSDSPVECKIPKLKLKRMRAVSDTDCDLYEVSQEETDIDVDSLGHVDHASKGLDTKQFYSNTSSPSRQPKKLRLKFGGDSIDINIPLPLESNVGNSK